MKGGQYIDKYQGKFATTHSYNDMGEDKLENEKIIDTPNSGDLLGILPKVYKIKGLTVNVERELKNDGRNCVDNLIEMIDRKKKEINNINLKPITE